MAPVGAPGWERGVLGVPARAEPPARTPGCPRAAPSAAGPSGRDRSLGALPGTDLAPTGAVPVSARPAGFTPTAQRPSSGLEAVVLFDASRIVTLSA